MASGDVTFRVGDMVRVTHAIWEQDRPFVGKEFRIEYIPFRGGAHLEGVLGGMVWEQLEPAREGADASTRKGDGVSPAAQDELSSSSAPPAPSPGAVEYFRSVLWPKAPPAFPLGQRKEPEVRREACPCCAGFLSDARRFGGPCPECEGRGWQEAR